MEKNFTYGIMYIPQTNSKIWLRFAHKNFETYEEAEKFAKELMYIYKGTGFIIYAI